MTRCHSSRCSLIHCTTPDSCRMDYPHTSLQTDFVHLPISPVQNHPISHFASHQEKCWKAWDLYAIWAIYSCFTIAITNSLYGTQKVQVLPALVSSKWSPRWSADLFSCIFQLVGPDLLLCNVPLRCRESSTFCRRFYHSSGRCFHAWALWGCWLRWWAGESPFL